MDVTLAAIGIASCMIFGIVWGTWVERQAWLSRAIDRADGPNRNSTPYHCNGKFYYVFEERTFVREFTLRHPQEMQKL